MTLLIMLTTSKKRKKTDPDSPVSDSTRPPSDSKLASSEPTPHVKRRCASDLRETTEPASLPQMSASSNAPAPPYARVTSVERRTAYVPETLTQMTPNAYEVLSRYVSRQDALQHALACKHTYHLYHHYIPFDHAKLAYFSTFARDIFERRVPQPNWEVLSTRERLHTLMLEMVQGKRPVDSLLEQKGAVQAKARPCQAFESAYFESHIHHLDPGLQICYFMLAFEHIPELVCIHWFSAELFGSGQSPQSRRLAYDNVSAFMREDAQSQYKRLNDVISSLGLPCINKHRSDGECKSEETDTQYLDEHQVDQFTLFYRLLLGLLKEHQLTEVVAAAIKLRVVSVQRPIIEPTVKARRVQRLAVLVGEMLASALIKLVRETRDAQFEFASPILEVSSLAGLCASIGCEAQNGGQAFLYCDNGVKTEIVKGLAEFLMAAFSADEIARCYKIIEYRLLQCASMLVDSFRNTDCQESLGARTKRAINETKRFVQLLLATNHAAVPESSCFPLMQNAEQVKTAMTRYIGGLGLLMKYAPVSLMAYLDWRPCIKQVSQSFTGAELTVSSFDDYLDHHRDCLMFQEKSRGEMVAAHLETVFNQRLTMVSGKPVDDSCSSIIQCLGNLVDVLKGESRHELFTDVLGDISEEQRSRIALRVMRNVIEAPDALLRWMVQYAEEEYSEDFEEEFAFMYLFLLPYERFIKVTEAAEWLQAHFRVGLPDDTLEYLNNPRDIFYRIWCEQRRQAQTGLHRVDDSPDNDRIYLDYLPAGNLAGVFAEHAALLVFNGFQLCHIAFMMIGLQEQPLTLDFRFHADKLVTLREGISKLLQICNASKGEFHDVAEMFDEGHLIQLGGLLEPRNQTVDISCDFLLRPMCEYYAKTVMSQHGSAETKEADQQAVTGFEFLSLFGYRDYFNPDIWSVRAMACAVFLLGNFEFTHYFYDPQIQNSLQRCDDNTLSEVITRLRVLKQAEARLGSHQSIYNGLLRQQGQETTAAMDIDDGQGICTHRPGEHAHSRSFPLSGFSLFPTATANGSGSESDDEEENSEEDDDEDVDMKSATSHGYDPQC